MKQIYAAHATAIDVYSLPDLSAALKQIQHQYDDIAAKNLQVGVLWQMLFKAFETEKADEHCTHCL